MIFTNLSRQREFRENFLERFILYELYREENISDDKYVEQGRLKRIERKQQID